MKLTLFIGLIIFSLTSGYGIGKERETRKNYSLNCKETSLIDKKSESGDIKLGIAFGDNFKDEIFMPYIRDLSADVTLIKLRWYDIEPYSPNDPRYVFDTTILDNFLNQLQDGDVVLINIFTASDWATDPTCENNTQRKGCPLKDDATCLLEYGITCKQAYRDFITKLVTYANNYLASKNIDAKIEYWQRDTEPATARHFPSDSPKAYVELQRLFYESVKSADPDAKVVGVCAAGGGTKKINEVIVPSNSDFFKYVIANARDYFDLIDIRFYHDVYSIPQRLKWFIQEMRKNNYIKPVISTEGGGPTTMEFRKYYGTILSWCINNGYTTEIELYDCLYDMDRRGLLPEEIAIFLPYDPRDQKSVLREEKVERMHCRDITQRTLIMLENNIKKQWRWEIRADKRNFCAGPNKDIDVYGSIVFNKLAFLRYPGVICNENSPIVPEKRKTSYKCYQRMQEKLNGVKNVERLYAGNPNIFFYKVNKLDGSHIFVIWERRDIFYGEEKPPTPFEIQVDFMNVKITDVFGNEKIKSTNNGILFLNITDTPLFIERTKAIKKRR
jgi:hypothetical protein